MAQVRRMHTTRKPMDFVRLGRRGSMRTLNFNDCLCFASFHKSFYKNDIEILETRYNDSIILEEDHVDE